jgi:hypothetical protein
MDMVSKEWKHIHFREEGTTMFKFCESLKKIKQFTKKWVKEKQNSSHMDLKIVEAHIEQIYEMNSNGAFSEDEQQSLKKLGDARRALLNWESAQWRL